MSYTAEELIQRRTSMINDKAMFTQQYQILSKYFYQTRQSEANNQQTAPTQGEFLNDGELTESDGMLYAMAMASAIQGAVWKGERSTFRIIPTRHVGELTQEIKDYYTRLNQDIPTYMERSRSRFAQAFSSNGIEVIVYGTTGMSVLKGDYQTPVRYVGKSVMRFYVSYNHEGDIDTIMLDSFPTARELYEKYGERAGPTIIRAYKGSDREKRFLLSELIEPRSNPVATSGRLSMPFASYVFLPGESVFIEEGGFESLPMKVLFQEKLEDESYGRSSAMRALPTVVSANIAAEILDVGGEATALPPLGFFDNGSFGNRTIDLSSGAPTVFNYVGSMPTGKPVFPIYEVGDLRVIYERWNNLHDNLAKHFLNDRLYEMGSQQRQTQFEFSTRAAIRADSLSMLFVQYFNFLSEILERTIEIEFGMGLLGVKDPKDLNDPIVAELIRNGHEPFAIPEAVLKAMMKGLDWYDIQYISPAARTLRNDEIQAATQFLNIMTVLGQSNPEFNDEIDPEGTSLKLKELYSADLVMLRPKAIKDEIRKRRQQMQEMMARMEMEATQAKANQSNAQAAAAQSGAMRNSMEMGVYPNEQQPQ